MRIGVAGIGAVGAEVARSLDRGDDPGCALSGIAARTVEKAAALNENLRHPVPVRDFADLAAASDCVIEALPPALFGDLAEPVLRAGKHLIVIPAKKLACRKDDQALARPQHRLSQITEQRRGQRLDDAIAYRRQICEVAHWYRVSQIFIQRGCFFGSSCRDAAQPAPGNVATIQ